MRYTVVIGYKMQDEKGKDVQVRYPYWLEADSAEEAISKTEARLGGRGQVLSVLPGDLDSLDFPDKMHPVM